MQPTIIIFANPIAGRGRGRIVARRLGHRLELAGFSVHTVLERPADISRESIDRSAVAAISIGGDGTLRGVVELLHGDGNHGPPLLPVPMGTANLMGRHLGVQWSTRNLGDAVLETIRRNKVINLDVARANGRLFMLMAGVGIDAHIIHLLDQMRRGPIDYYSYVLPAALTLVNYTFPAITVRVDDRTIVRDLPAVAVIGNVKEYGTGFPILTDARPDDGLLDICVMPCNSRGEMAELLMLTTTGEHVLREGVQYVKGRHVHIESAVSVPVHVDGDSAGHTPLQVDLLPGKVGFLVPA
jgi:diacylglycerol kinase (ATP)